MKWPLDINPVPSYNFGLIIQDVIAPSKKFMDNALSILSTHPPIDLYNFYLSSNNVVFHYTTPPIP